MNEICIECNGEIYCETCDNGIVLCACGNEMFDFDWCCYECMDEQVIP